MRNSCTYKIAGTKTFRLSSSKIFGKWGGNLQNIEKSMREIYIPDEGKIFVQVDQSGAEALIVAYISEAGRFRQLFENNIKPHVYVALRLFKDVWPKKMYSQSLITSSDNFDIDAVINTPITELKKNPLWKNIDAIIKDSDNWSLEERYYYLAKQTCHCIDSSTEVLTRAGWKTVDKVVTTGTLTEEIAVFGVDNTIHFEIPRVWNSMLVTDTMYNFVGSEVDQLVTSKHKVVYESNGKLHAKTAENAMYTKRLDIPTSGKYNGNTTLPDWQIKLLVAIQADGHWPVSEAVGVYGRLPKVTFRLKLQRKIDRLEAIIRDGNLRSTKSIHSDGATCITIFDLENTVKWFNNIKVWDSWLLNFSQANLSLLIDELKYWDGSLCKSCNHKREKYSTSIAKNADWIKTICSLTGHQGTESYYDGLYEVGINNRKYSWAKYKRIIKDWTGMVYCPTVSTGMFMIRRNGKISVTGNSGNYGITPPTFRMNVLEKSGGKIVISKEDAEFFITTYQSLFPEIFEWHECVRRQVEKHKILYNLHGHPYIITQPFILESAWKELYAWVPQSTVGEITNIAYSKLQRYIWDAGVEWDLLANTHDSYLVQCPIGEERKCALVMQEFMGQEFTSPIDGVKFRMKSEAQAGYNWAPAKKDKNMEGLKEIK